jgi:hypothetical protein
MNLLSILLRIRSWYDLIRCPLDQFWFWIVVTNFRTQKNSIEQTHKIKENDFYILILCYLCMLVAGWVLLHKSWAEAREPEGEGEGGGPKHICNYAHAGIVVLVLISSPFSTSIKNLTCVMCCHLCRSAITWFKNQNQNQNQNGVEARPNENFGPE